MMLDTRLTVRAGFRICEEVCVVSSAVSDHTLVGYVAIVTTEVRLCTVA
jgi:hypothetical protein